MTDNHSMYTPDRGPHRARSGQAGVRDAGRARSPTYAELGRDVARMANALAAAGVKAGDRVTAQVEKSLPNAVLYLACLKAGAVFNPLNSGYTSAELDYFIGDAEPTLLVCQRRASACWRRSPQRHKVETTLLLEPDGTGSLVDLAAAQPRHAHDGAARGRRPGRAALHLRHHGPLQGRDDHPRQPRLEHAGAVRDVAHHRRRRAAARAADLPRPRAVRGAQHHAGAGRADPLAAEIRPRAGDPAAAAGDADDGRADVLYAAAVERRPSAARPAATCGCSCRAPRRCWPRRTSSSRSAPATPSSSATA